MICGPMPELPAQEKAHLELDSPFGSYVDPSFPFFGHTVDARDLGNWSEGQLKDNLSPRGLVLRLDHGYWACFDPDLLRLALVWKETEDGEYLTMNGMGPGSYRLPGKKAGAGQGSLPHPLGTPLQATGLHAGWYLGDGKPALGDPRDRENADETEVGLGPLPVEIGRWQGIRLVGDSFQLEYEIDGVAITERYHADEQQGFSREITVAPRDRPLTVLLDHGPDPGSVRFHSFGPSPESTTLRFGNGRMTPGDGKTRPAPPIQRWPEPVRFERGTSSHAAANQSPSLAVDQVAIPDRNPWRRNVRFSGFDFFPDGRAAFCTFDGDVWMATGLEGGLSDIQWRRFAAGFNEAMGLEVVGEELFINDRGGLWRLRDTNEDGEADFYECLSNRVPQTAETREFPMDFLARPDGRFLVAKGGQVATTRGKANGTIVEISADGTSHRIIATGLRQPFIGLDPVSGLLTSSDQQGNWKPATPIYVIEEGGYYGFQPAMYKDKAVHPAAINDPAVWIPHFVNQSGASQVWLRDAQLGSLNDSLFHIGFNRPELFKVYLDDRGEKRQGGVHLVLGNFSSGLLRGRVHPIDGSLWLCGMKIWGTIAEELSGIYRLRPTGEPNWVPEEVLSSDRGILMTFSQPVDPAIAANAAAYSVDRWNYKQTHNYGSGNYQLDGTPGQETVPVASVKLSEDRRSVFLGIPDMQPVHSLRVSYRQPTTTELPVIQHAFLTIHELLPLDLAKAGFGNDEVDLTLEAGAGAAVAKIDPTIEIGKQVYTTYGCIACHTVDKDQVIGVPAGASGDEQAKVVVGPSWIGLWGARREFTDGSVLRERVDEVYLRESIIDPGRRVPKGFEMTKTGVGMPSYLGVLKDHEIDSVILYIKSLAEPPKKK